MRFLLGTMRFLLGCVLVVMLSFWIGKWIGKQFVFHRELVTIEDRPHGNGNGSTSLHAQSSIGANQSSSTQCISSLLDCDLSCLDWTVVLSMGRSGSTTIQQMISKLPQMNFYGEEGGLLKNLYQLQKKIKQQSRIHAPGLISWQGVDDVNVHTVACMTQKLFAERHGVKCLHRGCRHGWKEIRYGSPEMIEWIRTIFPTSKIILNYRMSCSNYVDNFGRDCKQIQGEKDSFLKATKDLKNVFHMELEHLNNVTKWNQLAKFIGYDDCEALNITTANMRGSYTQIKNAATYNPWSCSHKK